MSIEEINNLIYILTPKLKYNGIIFFGDIPQYNRIIELFYFYLILKVYLT